MRACGVHPGGPASARTGSGGPPPWFRAALLLWLTARAVAGDCWIVESDRNMVPRAICNQNTPPFDAIPRGLNGSIADLRLNRNKIRAVARDSLSRYPHLVHLDLSRNLIADVEERAFSAQPRLRVLLLGHNRLEVLTAFTFAGLPHLRELQLQANRLRRVEPLAFRQSGALVALDLAGNRLAALDAAALAGPERLESLELHGNPLHCECDLHGLLLWMYAHINVSSSSSSSHVSSPAVASWERLSCYSPPAMKGVPLLRTRGAAGHHRSAVRELAACRDHVAPPAPPAPTAAAGDPPGAGSRRPGGGEEEEEDSTDGGSGMATDVGLPGRRPTPAGPVRGKALPSLQLVSQARTVAVLRVQIPDPFDKMYVLAHYNRSAYSDVKNLRQNREEVRVEGLSAHRNYTYCVVSVRHARRTKHACLDFRTPGGAPRGAGGGGRAPHHRAARLRPRPPLPARRRGAELAKGSDVEEAAGGGGLDPRIPPPAPPADAKADEGRDEGRDAGGATKRSYMEVRAPAEAPAETRAVAGVAGAAERRGSAAEISTIAKEVDRVNLIINSCIDALRAEAPPPCDSSCSAPLLLLAGDGCRDRSGRRASRCPRPPRPWERGALTSPWRRADTRGPRRWRLGQSERGGGGAGGSGGSEGRGGPGAQGRQVDTGLRVAGSGGGERSAACAPLPGMHDPTRPLPPAPPRGGAGPEPPGPFGPRGPAAGPRRAPCPGAEPREAAAVRRSPGSPPPCRPGLRRGTGIRAYASSPECGGGAELRPGGPRGLWARIRRPLRRRAPWGPEMEPIAAGHALKRKVQLARHEDLHDILAYWKGVGAQRR
ncbi:unnamed protein product [Lampetra planeri]